MDHNSHFGFGLPLIVLVAFGIARAISSATRLGPTSELLVMLAVVGLLVSTALAITSRTRRGSRQTLTETGGAVEE